MMGSRAVVRRLAWMDGVGLTEQGNRQYWQILLASERDKTGLG